jgi:septum formation protein
VLASASPRRAELLRRLAVPFEVIPSGLEEAWPPESAREAVKALALAKARSVALRLPAALVLAADTVVVVEGAVFGKPESAEDARRMLRALRGREHEVITGVALVETPAGREAAIAVATRVLMRAYTEAEIDAYIASGEPFGKAGAYAIQGAGGGLVAHVEGCYTNVVGLPLTTTRRLLETRGIISSPEPP